MKRIISVLLTFTMLLSVTASVPLSASAVTADKLESNTAYTNEYGSWCYELTDDGTGYRITDYQGDQKCVQIPEAIDNVPVQEIGEYAFSDCENMRNLIIPNTITAIGKEILPKGMIALDVYYVGSVDEWGNIFVDSENEGLRYAFVSWDTYIDNNEYGKWVCAPGNYYEGYKIVDYSGDTTKVIVPSEINNTPIVEIGPYVFADYKAMTSILLPDTIKEIHSYAFENCTNLTEVYYTGADNDWYKTFVMYDGNQAFYEARVRFNSCIIDNESGEWICVTRDYQEGYKVVSYLGDDKTRIIVPDKVNDTPIAEIGEYIFANNTSMTSVVIPDSIVEIDEYAFENCTNLTGVYYTGDLNDWYRIFILSNGNDAVFNAYVYENISVLKNEYGIWICSCIDYNTIEYDKAYRILSYLGDKTEITIPSEINDIPVVEIFEYAFSNSNMTSIIIPDSIYNIDEYAFENCTSLTDVYYTGDKFRWNCVYIYNNGNDALLNANIHFSSAIINDEFGKWIFEAREYYETGYKLKSYSGNATEITIPSVINNISVTEIGSYAFADCNNITSVVIPDSVMSIKENAFKNCTSLTDVYFTGAAYNWYGISIEYNGNEALTNAYIHHNACVINDEFGTWLFAESLNLRGYQLISYSGDATEIVIPDKVNNKKVIEIGKSVFENNTELTKVIIPKTIEIIYEYAFKNCTGITGVYYSGDWYDWYKIFIAEGNEPLYEYEVINLEVAIKNDAYGDWVCTLRDFGDDNESGYIIKEYFGNAGRIVIPSEVDNIPVVGLGESLFENNNNLTKIVIPDSIMNIDRYVFFNCNNLKQVYYTGSLDDWFKLIINGNNDSLFTAYIEHEATMKADEFGAWIYDAGYGDSCIILDYIGNMSDVRIPSEIDNIPVTNFYRDVFKNYSNLTRLVFPDTIWFIDDSAFEGCTNLKEVYYEGSEQNWEYMLSSTSGNESLLNAKIHYNAYVYSDNYGAWVYSLSNLRGYAITTYLGNKSNIRIPSKIDNVPVTEISEYAFASCDNLSGVTIPYYTTKIAEFAFSNCNNLNSVYYIGAQSQWDNISIYEGNQSLLYATYYFYTDVIFDEYGTWILQLTNTCDGYIIKDYIGSMSNIKIPSGLEGIPVVGIGDDVFSGSYNLISVVIPDSVKTIGYNVFYNCTSLTNVTLSKNLTSIGGYAFFECSSLANITLPDSLTSIGEYAFYKCENLTSISLPDAITSIDKFTFLGCEKLASITLPDAVTFIGDSAFSWCSALTSVTLPENLITIDEDAFYSCRGLTNITIPKSVTTIGDEAFFDCENLTGVTIPENVTSIGEGVFTRCESLLGIEVSANNKSYISVDGVLFNKTQSEILAYPAGKLSNSYIIPASVKAIPDELFSYCSNLVNITIPNSVTAIGDYAFEYCGSLTNIKIPDSVTSIGKDAFYRCSSLTNITLPKSITSISNSTFCYCTNLTSITIPNSITTIGSWAFYGCNNLSDVYYTGSEAEWNSILIRSSNDSLKNATIHYNYTSQVTGDVSGDGTLAVNDVIYVLKNIVGTQDLTDEQIALADISGDGKLSVLDAIMLQRIILDMV